MCTCVVPVLAQSSTDLSLFVSAPFRLHTSTGELALPKTSSTPTLHKELKIFFVFFFSFGCFERPTAELISFVSDTVNYDML